MDDKYAGTTLMVSTCSYVGVKDHPYKYYAVCNRSEDVYFVHV